MTYTKKQLDSINLRAGRFDMTQIPRLRTDFTEADGVYNYQALNALNARCNENSERVEDLWIELDLQLIDAIEAEKKRKANRKPNLVKREVIDLYKRGYLASEIKSITKATPQEIARWTGTATKQKSAQTYGFDSPSDLYGSFEDCPEDIKADLDEWDV